MPSLGGSKNNPAERFRMADMSLVFSSSPSKTLISKHLSCCCTHPQHRSRLLSAPSQHSLTLTSYSHIPNHQRSPPPQSPPSTLTLHSSTMSLSTSTLLTFSNYPPHNPLHSFPSYSSLSRWHPPPHARRILVPNKHLHPAR